jgi:hypothetical protein
MYSEDAEARQHRFDLLAGERERGTGQVDLKRDDWVGSGKVTVKIENAYSDGHQSTTTVTVDGPEDGVSLDCWWADEVYQHTGDGHGDGQDYGSCYTATIIAAEHPGLIGKTAEWTD